MKKVLIITYYFPPAGGPGVQRWLKFVKYLPDFGIQPIVYIPENPTYPIIDQDLVSDVAKETIIIKHKIFEPYHIATFFSKSKTQNISSGIIPNQKKQSLIEKVFLWVRGNLFIPDARIFWVKPSVKYLEQYIKQHDIQTIITTGPPHSLHLIGLELKNKFAIHWLADFRDPWTTIGYHKELKLSKFAENKHKKLEKLVLETADQIIVTSKTTKIEFQELTHKPITVITNGYDLEVIEEQELDAKFSMAHIGSFLSERNPKILWECISELVNEIPGFSNHLQIKLIGAISQEVLDTLTQYKMNNFLVNMGYVSHKVAVMEQRKSQVLLLIEINSQETKGILPGKLFEYLISGRPIIAIGPTNSDFEEIIEHTNTGIFIKYDEKFKLKKVVLEYYNLFLEGKLKSNATGLEQYSRKNLTEKLAEIMKH